MKYRVVHLDQYSGFCISHTIREKSDVTQRHAWVKQLVKNQFGYDVKEFHSDGGGEFVNGPMTELMQETGTIQTWTCARTPKQNPFAERSHLSIDNKIRCMLFDAQMPPFYWPLAAACATYVQNCTAKKGQTKTPYELWHGVKPDASFLKPFGCRAYVWKHHEECASKLSKRAWTGRMAGYDLKTPGNYIIWDSSSQKVVSRRDVLFDEDTPMGKVDAETMTDGPQNAPNLMPATEHKYQVAQTPLSIPPLSDVPQPTRRSTRDCIPAGACIRNAQQVNAASDTRSFCCEPSVLGPNKNGGKSVSEVGGKSVSEVGVQMPDGDGSQGCEPSEKGPVQQESTHMGDTTQDVNLQKLKMNNNQVAATTGVKLSPTAHGAKGGRAPVMSEPALTEDMEVEISPDEEKRIVEPTTLKQAQKLPQAKEWEEAIKQEIQSLQQMGTWEITPKRKGMKVVSSKWVFKVKRNKLGKIEKYKARLVARGFTQTYGIDYFETYASVGQTDSLRFLIAWATQNQKRIYHIDVKNAYLNGKLEDEIHMSIPEGVDFGEEFNTRNHVLKLKKPLYGLSKRGTNGKRN